jgi:hypothetical protein
MGLSLLVSVGWVIVYVLAAAFALRDDSDD